MNRFSFFALLFCVVLFGFSADKALASGDATHPPQIRWDFEGPFGTYDKAALQRGYKIYREVCAACHGMDRLYYRNLEALGYSEDQIKNIAAEYSVMDGPNDEGEMFERAARPSDPFKKPFANEQAAKYANNGALPPDLSLIVKARPGGANYIYGILTGYKSPPKEEKLLDGQYWNEYMPNHVMAMAPPLSDALVAYEDSTKEILSQYAADVAQFLHWAADPYLEERKRTGFKALFFLIIFAGVLYAVKRKIWAHLH